MKPAFGVGLLGLLAMLAMGAQATRLSVDDAGVAGEVLSGHDAKPDAPETLEFRELVEYDGTTPRLSGKAQSLSGRRVRMVGYIAHLEQPPADAFYLTPIPVHGDESGAGTADLPLESVLVRYDPRRSGVDTELDCQVEVSGLLEVGYAEDSEGRAQWLRLIID